VPDAKRSKAPKYRLALATVCAALLSACSDSPEAMLLSAKEYLAANDTNAAAIQLKNALQNDGNLAEARFLLGKVNLEQGNIPGAVKELRRAIERGYPETQVAPYLARALVLSGEFDQVIKEFGSRTLEDPAAHAQLLVAVGDAHLGAREPAKAREAFQSALDKSPGNPSAMVGVARTKLAVGDLDGALADADAALAAKSDIPEAHALRADVLTLRGRSAEALAALDAAIEARPQALDYHFARISTLLRENRVDDAVARLKDMKQIAPAHPTTRYLEALVALRTNKPAEAQEHIAEVVRLAPDFLPGRLLSGTIHIQMKRYVQAQEDLSVVLSRAPGQPLARRLLAMSQLALGDSGDALTTLQPLLDSPTVDSAALSLAGRISAAGGEFDRAAEYYAKVVAAQPDDAGARTRLGLTRLMGGDADRAFADLEAASDLDPDAGQADVALILAHLRRGELGEAMAAQQQYEKKQPDSPQPYTLKGGILLAKKDLAGARAALEKALEIKPDYLSAVVNLARMDIAEGQPQAARDRVEKIVKANPKNIDAHLLLAQVIGQTGGKPDDVRVALERAASANPAAVAPKLALVRHYLAVKDAKKGLAAAQELAAARPADPQAIEMLARAQVANEDLRQAVASLNKLVALLPQAPAPLVELADVQRLAKDRLGAEQSLRKALALKPELLDAQRRLVVLYLEDKRTDDALAVSRAVQRQRPKAAAGHVLEGDIHAHGGNWTQAVSAFRKALDREPTPQTAVTLHMAQLKAGTTGDAEKTAADWLRAQPKDVLFRNYLAERALAERRYDDAEKLYQKIADLSPNNVQALNNLAWVAGKNGSPKAIAIAEKALALAPRNPAVLDTLGMLQVEQGRREEGLENLRKAVGLAPDADALRLNLARAYLKLERKDDARAELDGLLKKIPEGSPLHVEATSLKQGL
jgi:putative PEP-CTERM system TPR-repeat lipoprotein